MRGREASKQGCDLIGEMDGWTEVNVYVCMSVYGSRTVADGAEERGGEEEEEVDEGSSG